MIERVIIDVNSRKVIRLKMPPDQHRSTLCDDIACQGTTLSDTEWSPDSGHLAFVSTSRDHKQEWLRVADASTGDVRDVMTESVPKFFESGINKINWHYLPGSNEFSGSASAMTGAISTFTTWQRASSGTRSHTALPTPPQVLYVDQRTA